MRYHHLSVILFLAFCGPAVAQQRVCMVPLDALSSQHDIPPEEIRVSSDSTQIQQDAIANFSGNVEIQNKNARIEADRAQIDKNKQKLEARGEVSFRNEELQVNSDGFLLDMNSGQLTLNNTHYRLAQLSGRGSAQRIALSTAEGMQLEEVFFTSCPVGDEDWRIQASRISIDSGKFWGEARNTRFYLYGVPVMYLPYFAFPVAPVRQTGLLFPEISSTSSTGVSIEQPFYWNIAPNYDATIAPRFMVNRGIQLKTEFRYLQPGHQGQINLEYLPNDRQETNDTERFFYRYVHTGKLADNWQISADINGLSDDNYIVDLGSDFFNRADAHLHRRLGVSYFSEQLDFSANFRDFQVIGDHPSTYRALPELKLFYQTDKLAGFEFRLNSELAYFDNKMPNAPTATRFHVAPSLALPFQSQWGELLAEASLLNTYYHQDKVAGTALEKDVNRTLGQARIYGALNFERQANWFGQQQVTQTLEPKFQYLYTSFEDQSNIGLYDTTRLFNDFNGLFRGQEFTGLDRISDNNQITLGVTSRVLDKNNREQFKLSVGQIFYLADNKVLEAEKGSNRSALASELDWRLGSRWFVHSELQITTGTDRVERSSLALEYQLDEDKIIQLTHRFVRNLSNERINQLGISASWPLNKHWHWVGRWYKDLEQQRTIESYTGLQYESCCWSMSLVAQRHLSNRFDATGMQSQDEFESSINFKFSFKFGGQEGRYRRRQLLEDGLFGYSQPYVFN